MYQYELLLFDLDGTLMDFEGIEKRALKATFEHFYIAHNEKNVSQYLAANHALWRELEQGLRSLSSIRNERFFRFLQIIGANTSLSDAMGDFFIQQLYSGDDLLPHALESLQSMREGHKIALVTNGYSDVQRARLSTSPIKNYIDGLYISEETGYSKPHPHMIERAMQDFGVVDKSRVLFIGDSLSSDIGAANNAGIDSVLIAKQANSKATYCVRNIAEVVGIANRPL